MEASDGEFMVGVAMEGEEEVTAAEVTVGSVNILWNKVYS